MPPSQVDVCEAAAAIERVDEGVAAGAGGAEAADVGVCARLAVLAAGQHHHVALARPARVSDILSFLDFRSIPRRTHASSQEAGFTQPLRNKFALKSPSFSFIFTGFQA